MIHLAGPVVLASALAGAGVYGLLARRNAVLVLIGAELLLNAVNVLLVTAGSLPAGGLAALTAPPGAASSGAPADATAAVDPLLPGPVLAIVVITIAAAEIGLALAVVLLTFRQRATSDLTAIRELGEASPTYEDVPDAGELTKELAPPGRPGDDPGPGGPGAPAGVGATAGATAAAGARPGAVR